MEEKMLKVFKFFSKKQIAFICVSLAFIVFQVYLDLKVPDYLTKIMTLVQLNSDTSDVLEQGVYMILVSVLSMVISIVVGYFAANVAAGLSRTLRREIFSKTLSFSMEEINNFSPSSLITRCTNDITQIQMLIAIGLQAIIKAPILAVWAILKIAGKNYHWTLATGVAVIVLLIMLSFVLLVAVPKFKLIQGMTDKINNVTRENLTGIRVVRAYNADQYEEEKFAKANKEISDTYTTVGRIMAIMMPGMTIINSGLSLAVYWIGAYVIDKADINDKMGLFSDMTVFLNYSMQIIMSFMLLIFIFILLPRAQVSANRIMEVLNTKIKIKDGDMTTNTSEEKGKIEFKNVSFKYADGAKEVLSDISFTVDKGETLAIIGSTGSGKTSLINLIPRFYETTKGEILVNGKNVKDYKLKDLRDVLGYVSQKTFLFKGNIKSNVAYGIKEIDDEKITESIDIAQGTDFVMDMADKYDSQIAQAGTNVSGGQKQRISIARAIYKNPEIFIFDDSFSALDYRTDRLLRTKLSEKLKDATKIIVAQRIGTIKDADKIIVLEHGKIAGMGTHRELLNNCDTYKEIAYSQLSKEELAND